MRVVVVTGTDTGVGKTVATSALARVAVDSRQVVAVVKPTQTGIRTGEPSDVATVTRLSGVTRVSELVRLDEALAPDTAARRLGLELPTVAELAARTIAASDDADLALVEGAGGIAVRLDTDGGTLLGLATAIAAAGHDVRFVVVTRLGLGTLNHTVLTVDAIRSAGHRLAGLLIGSVPDRVGLAERCNLTELPRLTSLPLLGAVPAGAGALEPADFRTGCARWIPDAGWLAQP